MSICIENVLRIVHFCQKNAFKMVPKFNVHNYAGHPAQVCPKVSHCAGDLAHLKLARCCDIHKNQICVGMEGMKYPIMGETENLVAKLCRTVCVSVRHNLS